MFLACVSFGKDLMFRQCFLLLLVFFLPLVGHGQEKRTAELRTTFRPGHNLAVTGLLQQSEWKFKETENIAGYTFKEWERGVNLRYSFLISLFGNTGMALGTSVLYFQHGQSSKGAYKPGGSLSFPSLLIGAVQSLGTDHRLSLLAEYSAFYFPTFVVNTRTKKTVAGESEDRETVESQRVRTSLLPDSWAITAQEEIFVSRAFSLVVALGYRNLWSNCVGECSSSAFVNSIQFRQHGSFAGMGVNWQAGLVLDE